MSDRRRIKLVITAISDSDNFEVDRGRAYTEVVDVVVEDDVTLQQVLQRCRRPIIDTVEEDLKMMSDEAEAVVDNWMRAHGFESRRIALQDLLLEFRDRRKYQ